MNASKENKIVGIGSVVIIRDLEFNEESSYKLVEGTCGGDGQLSVDSILGQTLLGHTVGEKVHVNAVEQYEVEILEVDNLNVKTQLKIKKIVSRSYVQGKFISGGQTSKAFYAYLVNCGYKEFTEKGQPSTVSSYVNAIENVCSWENLTWQALAQNIDGLLKDYDFGGQYEYWGNQSHRTVYNALAAYFRFVKRYRII